jgi:hypothetical protein
MVCAICQIRRSKRACPGVNGSICSICCGQEREVSVACPLDCEYLQDARRHDKPVPFDPAAALNRDVPVTERFLAEQEELLVFLGQRLAAVAMETAGVVDSDVRDVLDALIRTYRTLQSGVYYETRPENALAGRLFVILQESIAEFRRAEQERTGLPKTRDTDILGVLVFFERLALERNNGRIRGRAFIDLMRSFYSPAAGAPADAASSRLVVP